MYRGYAIWLAKMKLFRLEKYNDVYIIILDNIICFAYVAGYLIFPMCSDTVLYHYLCIYESITKQSVNKILSYTLLGVTMIDMETELWIPLLRAAII